MVHPRAGYGVDVFQRSMYQRLGWDLSGRQEAFRMNSYGSHPGLSPISEIINLIERIITELGRGCYRNNNSFEKITTQN